MNNVWEDYEVQHQSEAGEATMAKQAPQVTTHTVETNNAVSFLAVIAQLDEFARRQMIETIVRAHVTEMARTEVLIDSIEVGEDAIMDLKGARPGPDSVAEGRTVSEKQGEFLLKLHTNLNLLTDAMDIMIEAYESTEGELPTFGLVQERGEWKQIKQLSKAKDHEYRRAVEAKLRRAESAKENGYDAAGTQALVEQQRKARESKVSRYG